MSPVIRIPNEIYARLEQHVKGFDTPTNAMEGLLEHCDSVDNISDVAEHHQTRAGSLKGWNREVLSGNIYAAITT